MAESRIEELRQRVRREPGSRLFAQLAEEERKAGQLEEAIRVARAGLATHAGYPAAWLTLGRALLESGDAEGGRMALQEAVKQAPDNILAGRFLAQALEAAGELEAAAGQCRATLARAPGDAQLEARLQSLLARLVAARREEREPPARRGDEAGRPENEERTGADGPPFSSSTLAELYLRQGFTKEAIEVYKQVVAERPDEERARARLAELVSGLAGGAAEGSGDEQEGRRRTLKRTIAGLELLLGIARRR